MYILPPDDGPPESTVRIPAHLINNNEVGLNGPVETVSGSRYSCALHFKEPEHIWSCSHCTNLVADKSKTVTKSIP
jgi:hypothetical protein